MNGVAFNGEKKKKKMNESAPKLVRVSSLFCKMKVFSPRPSGFGHHKGAFSSLTQTNYVFERSID